MTTASLRSRPSGFASGSSTPSILERVKRVGQYRRILKLLVTRDLKVRYAGSFLGYLWTILDPLMMSLVYWFIFTKIFHRGAGPDYAPYMLYLVSGQLPWFWFNGGVSGTNRALRAEAQMVRSSNVPRELWVLRVICSKYIEYLFGLPVLIVFAICYLTAPTPYVFVLPLAWVLEITLLLGVGLILAPLNVLVRDVERVVPIVLRVLFYASPVLYSVEQAPKALRSVYTFNPCTGFLQLSRAVFFKAALYQDITVRTRDKSGNVVYHEVVNDKGQLVKRAVTHIEHINHWNWVWHSAVVSVFLLIVGAFVFTRLERHVLKEI